MPLFLGFLRDTFKMRFSDVLEEEVSKYIRLNRNKVQYVWIGEFKKWLKELKEVIDQENMIKKALRKKNNGIKKKRRWNRSFRMEIKDGKNLSE